MKLVENKNIFNKSNFFILLPKEKNKTTFFISWVVGETFCVVFVHLASFCAVFVKNEVYRHCCHITVQDNQRLQLELLEAPKTEMKFESNLEQVAQVEETEKDELPSPIVANSKFGTSWGIGLSVVGIVAVLFFTAITTGQGAQWLPLMQEKIAAALKNNVPNAGNHWADCKAGQNIACLKSEVFFYGVG